MKNIIYLISMLLLYSCGNNAQTKTETQTETEPETTDILPVLDIEYAYEHGDQVNPSFLWNDLIENVRFIPLETKKECLIGGGSSAILAKNDSLIIVMTLGQKPTFLFDSTGRFIKTIALPGKGPGEIFGILLEVYPFTNHPYLMFNAMYQNVIKDLNGNLIREFKGVHRLLYPHGSGFVHINQYDRFPNDSTFLCFTDSSGNIIKELKEPPKEKRINPNLLDTPFNGTDYRYLFFTDNKLRLLKSYNDTLYRITEDQTIKPHLILSRGKYTPIVGEKDQKRLGLKYSEAGPYSLIYTSGVFHIWNRETGKLITSRKFDVYNPDSYIKYRLPNNQLITVYFQSVQNGKLVFEARFNDIYEYLNLKEDDNPVIMIADLKKN